MVTKKPANIALIKQAMLTKLANKRTATSAVKSRGEVRGGGRKPWRQKGTGRARAGTTRSPIWVGGGQAFGPTKEQNFRVRLPKKMQRAAFAEVLRINKDAIKTVAKFDLKEPKTKLAVEWLKKQGVEGASVLVTANIEPELILATNNLKKVSVVTRSELSIIHFNSNATVVMEKAVFESLFPEEKTTTVAKKASTTAKSTKEKK